MSKSIPKTKLMIINSLLDLMKTKSFSSITITELCSHGEVGRKSYYRHFNTKHEIIILHLSLLMEDAIEHVKRDNPSNLHELLTIYFTYWQNHRSLINLLRKHQLCYLMVFVSENFFENEAPDALPVIGDMSKMMTIFTFSGATRVLQKWIYDDMQVSARNITAELTLSLKAIL